jgi:hypothetical protein
MWWLLVHGKSVRVDDTTYFGLASSLTAQAQAGEERVCFGVGDSLLVVDATVEGDVDAEGQKSHVDE